ncbi:hypothetical protein G7092_21780 [Mucilaginibacter sp. HC2]|uniref:hypothetical protein n=1 Tax=Mucilaginibacter inviolabilis TaxID=2714892 RepID=UPI001409DB0C|nr:hypothetical protein [Mucilaginibacter inviolabilis]NHA06454.1 hypothetical protein [Mucilaginibacter inviolabilis]
MAIKRNVLFITIIGFFALFVIAVVCYFNFPLFQREDTPMAQINLNGAIINIKFVQSGATTQDVVQVTMKRGTTDERVISNITRMNFLISYELINDTTLNLTLKDTVFASNKAHVFKIRLPK